MIGLVAAIRAKIADCDERCGGFEVAGTSEAALLSESANYKFT